MPSPPAFVSNVNRPSVTVASGYPVRLRIFQRTALIRTGGDHRRRLSAQALQLGLKDLYEFTLDRIPVALRLYEDQKLQSTKTEPNGGVEVIGSARTRYPIVKRDLEPFHQRTH